MTSIMNTIYPEGQSTVGGKFGVAVGKIRALRVLRNGSQGNSSKCYKREV
jgi:hypothetical protein